MSPTTAGSTALAQPSARHAADDGFDALDDCHRPSYRVFRMGGDVLFDCDLRSRDTTTALADVARVI